MISANKTYLEKIDPEIFQSLLREEDRQENNIELIASENFVSLAVLEAMGSILTNKYAEGYPKKRYYGGCQFVDEIEELARVRLKELFQADHVNVQPHSGASANIASYLAFLKPGDKVLGMELSQGGHLTHGSKVNISGKYFEFVHYGLDEKTDTLDYDQILEIAKKEKPKMIVAGASAYPRIIDFSKFRDIADQVGAYLMVDMAHIAGLVAAGLHPTPVGYADVITSTSHKTMRGPRGAFILSSKEHAKKIDSAVFPGSQGGPLMHIIAGKAVSFKEALDPSFKEYQKQIIKNAKAMEEVFHKEDIPMVSGGTDNHLLLIDVRKFSLTGQEAEKMLDDHHITCNKNTLPNDPNGVLKTSGIRIGTPAMTTRGLKEEDMKKVSHLIIDVLKKRRNQEEIIRDVKELCSTYPLYR